MKTLVLVEHEGGAAQGRDARRRHRRRASSAKSTCWSPAAMSARSPKQAAKIAGVGKVHVADDAALRASAGRECRAARRRADGRPRRLPRARHHHRQEHRPARRRLARRDADHRHPRRSRATTPSPARSTPATPSPRSSSTDAKKVITVRGTAFEKAARDGGSGRDRAGRRRRRCRPVAASSAPRSRIASGPS